MGQGKYLWGVEDFPLFCHNQEAFKVEEKAFKNEFKKVQRLLNKHTDISSEINTSLGIVETVFNSLIEGVNLDSQNMFDSMLGNSMLKREEKSALMTLKLAMDNYDASLTHALLQELHKTLLPEKKGAGQYVGNMKIVEGNIYMGEGQMVHRGVPKDKVNEANFRGFSR